jgi:predicted outer membrane repeat protein
MRALATVFVVIGILVAATREPAAAATLNVPGSYTTIAKAITASKSGDVIVIAPGTYKENLSLKSGVTLRGAGMGVTIIDGRAIGTVIYVTGAATPSTIIEDLTVTNGKNTNGAGIKLGPENECQVRRVEFRSNVATNRGGGLYLDVNSRATIEYNFFVENRAKSGGAIYCQTSFSTFRFNVIYDNVATVNGGGFYGAFDCSDIYNNTIDGNQSPGNGANVALASPASTKFYRNILTNGEDGFGLWQSGGTLTNSCNVIWQNESGQMSGASPPVPNTIFNVDPLYCDYAIKDFHLQGPSPAALVDCKEPADFVGALPVNCNFLEPTQACCYPEGVCNDLTVDECVAQGGTPQGEGTSCEDVTCEPPPDPTQACCFADGTCFDVTVAECVSEDGVPQGEGSTCESASCPPPPPTPQACCFHVGSCADLLEADCIAAGGLPQGPGTNCATTPDCENLGACCLDDGSCIAQTAQGCTAQGGVFQGVGVRCRDAHCVAERTLKHAATESKTWGGIKRIYR